MSATVEEDQPLLPSPLLMPSSSSRAGADAGVAEGPIFDIELRLPSPDGGDIEGGDIAGGDIFGGDIVGGDIVGGDIAGGPSVDGTAADAGMAIPICGSILGAFTLSH